MGDENRLIAAGTGSMSTTLDNAAATELASDGSMVRIPATNHKFKAGSIVEISGTTNYDGIFVIAAVATNTFDIYSEYTAETFSGSETVTVVLTSGSEFELLEVKLHVKTASVTSENFTVTRDANEGAYWDELVRAQNMAGTTDFIWDLRDTPLRYQPDDKLTFDWLNSDGRTWGLEVLYRRIRG